MATITFEYYGSTGPAWTDIGANTVVFTGTGGIGNAVNVNSWQDETHIGSGDPGTDQCGTNHCNNVKWISSNQFDSGGGTETLNDTNLTANECTLRIHFNHGSAVTVSAARCYIYDGTTVTTEAPNVEVQAFEQGESNTTWTEINDDSAGIGGDNSGERLTLATKASATDHYWYLALSIMPEDVGNLTAFDLGFALTYS